MAHGTAAESPLTPAVFHILLALAEGPLHGYGIMKRIEEDSGVAMGPGTVYGSIQRLQDAGWVTETDSESGDARRGRSFGLTEEGREALSAEAARLRRLARLVAARDLAVDPGHSG